MKTIGSRIAAARERKGINQSALSRLVGVKPQSVQAWEADRNTPRPKRLSLIAAALDVSVSALVDGIEVETNSSYQASLAGQAKEARRAAYLKDGEILIQKYELASMVKEEMPTDYVDLVSDLTVGIRQLDGLGIKYSDPTNLSIITAWDQSMASTIHDKDFVLIDRGINQYAGDGVYLIAWAGYLLIRRLQLAGTDKLELVADSPTHKSRVVPAGKIVVHARALLVWKAGKL
ncbi:XRE family transcriptional regulator [Pseudomonas sp. TCU-HL1]|uniref:XRE family transcriptional regulator n=1 Tax=Pseudomonas sp. TCU-HL1 TaxID=1856685 RepID=UPI00137482F0|nr:LexA family transcriptional regulator [Pseudomonas sp. TCU-HL1]